MQVIVFASQKGGSGKTTLAGHMAVLADALGLGPVAMLDTDPQGSLAQWWNARRAETPLFVRSSLTELPETLAELDRRRIRLVVIDTPPAITIAIRSVVENADLVVVPVRPSPHDLRAAGATVDLVEGLARPFVFVVNAASSRARITSDAAVALSQHGTVAPVTVHNRTEYAASMSDGRTVMEINPEGRSAEEMVALWGYLQTRLERVARQAESSPAARTGLAFADFVRETREPIPQAARMAERLGIPMATIDPVASLSGAAGASGAGAGAGASPAPGRRAAQEERPMAVVEGGVDDDDMDDEDGDETGTVTGTGTGTGVGDPESAGRSGASRLWGAGSGAGGWRAGSRRDGTAAGAGAQAPAYGPHGARPVPAQGRGASASGFGHRHAFGRRGLGEG